MTLLDGHGRTPHDALEQFLSGAAMICCLPIICVVKVCEKLKGLRERSRGGKEDRKEEGDGVKLGEMREK